MHNLLSAVFLLALAALAVVTLIFHRAAPPAEFDGGLNLETDPVSADPADDGAYVRAVVGRERNPATEDAPPPPPAESDDEKVRRALQGDSSAVVRRDARKGFIEVRVRKGDTLSSLAKTHLGESSQWRAIFDANPDLSRPEDVREGQLLRIPTR